MNLANPEILMVGRLILQVATVFLLARYHAPDSRFRLGPSALAGICMMTSAGLTVPMLLHWDQEVHAGTQVLLLLLALTMFGPVAWARGDMAKVYDTIRRRPKA
jgi:hypothetical protein